MFRDRSDAGEILAAGLSGVARPPCIVAAIPRGGVPVAIPIIARLGVPLTVVYARKLTAAVAPELAFGAVDEDGQETLDPAIVADLRLSREDVAAEHRRVLGEIRRRMELYRVPPLSRYLPGRSVVLVDDGLATGLTMQAAVGYARRHGAREITIAVPCASARAVERLRGRVDRLVSLTTDANFRTVGQYYRAFPAVADEDVKAMLEQAAQWAAAAAPEVSAMFDAPGGALIATLLLPTGAARHAVVILVEEGDGSTVSEDRAIAEVARSEGTAVLCLARARPAPGPGRAEARRSPDAEDVLAAARWLRSRTDVDPTRIGIAGGGGAAGPILRAAARDPGFRAVVLWSPGGDVEPLAIQRLTTPTLLVVGEHDEPGRRTAEALTAMLDGPRRIEVVKGVNARFDEPRALDQAATVTVRWAQQHLGAQG